MTSPATGRASVEIAGTEITFETGKLAKQASGSVVVRAGETMVLCTATAGNLRDVDFLPADRRRRGADVRRRARSPAASSSARGAPPRRASSRRA